MGYVVFFIIYVNDVVGIVSWLFDMGVEFFFVVFVFFLMVF